MSGIYLKHSINTLITITSPKVNLQTIIRLTKEILPNSAPLNYRAIEGGFYLSFVQDKEINSFFLPQNLNKLKRLDLTPTLSLYSKLNREIYVPGITRDIYYLPKDKIITEIKKNHNLDILKVNLFLSRGDIRYLVITTDSRIARDNLIKTPIKLFGCEYKPQPKLQTRSTQQQLSSLSGRHHHNKSQASSWRNPPSTSNNIALPNSSDWGGPRRSPATTTANKTGLTVLRPRPRTNTLPVTRPTTAGAVSPVIASTPGSAAGSQQQQDQVAATNNYLTPTPEQIPSPASTTLPTPAKRTRPPAPATTARPTPTARPTSTARPTPATRTKPVHQLNTPQQKDPLLHTPNPDHQTPAKQIRDDINVLKILSTISEALSSGIEHPEVYRDIFAICLTSYGYQNVTIPKYALEMSKNIFHFKNPEKPRVHIPFSALHNSDYPLTPTFQIPVLTTT